jgi:hypothetical protein
MCLSTTAPSWLQQQYSPARLRKKNTYPSETTSRVLMACAMALLFKGFCCGGASEMGPNSAWGKRNASLPAALLGRQLPETNRFGFRSGAACRGRRRFGGSRAGADPLLRDGASRHRGRGRNRRMHIEGGFRGEWRGQRRQNGDRTAPLESRHLQGQFPRRSQIAVHLGGAEAFAGEPVCIEERASAWSRRQAELRGDRSGCR